LKKSIYKYRTIVLDTTPLHPSRRSGVMLPISSELTEMDVGCRMSVQIKRHLSFRSCFLCMQIRGGKYLASDFSSGPCGRGPDQRSIWTADTVDLVAARGTAYTPEHSCGRGVKGASSAQESPCSAMRHSLITAYLSRADQSSISEFCNTVPGKLTYRVS
jgi:hypothetical protein